MSHDLQEIWKLDIAIDRNGLTAYCRPNIFACESCPVAGQLQGLSRYNGHRLHRFAIADPIVVRH